MAEEQVRTQEEQAAHEDSNIIFIGEKPFMNYVTGVVTQFKTKNQKEVIIKARGKFISRAVDVAEVSAKKFLKEEKIKVKDIKIDSQEFENKEFSYRFLFILEYRLLIITAIAIIRIAMIMLRINFVISFVLCNPLIKPTNISRRPEKAVPTAIFIIEDK